VSLALNLFMLFSYSISVFVSRFINKQKEEQMIQRDFYSIQSTNDPHMVSCLTDIQTYVNKTIQGLVGNTCVDTSE